MPAEPDPLSPTMGECAAWRVAVVGGGVSGLVAARDLALNGCEVTLFEGDDRLGGRIRSAVAGPLPGNAFDIGAEAFATRGGSVAALLAELGLEREIVAPEALGSWLVAADRAVRLPPAGTLGIPAAPLSAAAVRVLGITGALRAALEPLIPRQAGRSGDADPSVGALVRARLGTRVLDRLVRPVALGVYSADPDRLPLAAVPGLAAAFDRTGSLAAAARELRESQTASGGAVAGLRRGMTDLVDALTAELDRLGVHVELGSPVEQVSADPAAVPEAGGCMVGARSKGSTRQRIERFDGVVLAVPESAARSLLGASPSRTPETLVEVIALVVDDPRLDAAPRGTGALVADLAGQAIRAKALTHVTAKWGARATAFGSGRHLLRLSYGRAGRPPETRQLDDAAARQLALRDASRILGLDLAAASVQGMARRTWHMAAPGSARGSGPANAAEQPTESWIPPGIAVAGDWVSGAGLASVIPGARRAAETLIRSRPHRAPTRLLSESPHVEGTART